MRTYSFNQLTEKEQDVLLEAQSISYVEFIKVAPKLARLVLLGANTRDGINFNNKFGYSLGILAKGDANVNCMAVFYRNERTNKQDMEYFKFVNGKIQVAWRMERSYFEIHLDRFFFCKKVFRFIP